MILVYTFQGEVDPRFNPTAAELEALNLPAFETPERARDYISTLPPGAHAVTFNLAKKRAVDARRERLAGRRVSGDRILELMTQHGCSRPWAHELLRRELAGEAPKTLGRPAKEVDPALEARAAALVAERGCSLAWARRLAAREKEGVAVRPVGRPRKNGVS